MTNKTTRQATIEDCPDYPLTKRIAELESQLKTAEYHFDRRDKEAEQAEARITELEIDLTVAGGIIGWMLGDKLGKVNIPIWFQKAKATYCETIERAEQAEAENKRLRAALEPFAKLYRERKDWHPHGDYIPRHELASNSFSGEVVRITSADCYRAEQAMQGESYDGN